MAEKSELFSYEVSKDGKTVKVGGKNGKTYSLSLIHI